MSFSSDADQADKIEHYRSMARAYIDRINAKDLEGILALYAEDAEVHDPVGQRDLKGKVQLRAFYEGVITRARMEIVGPVRGSFTNAVATPVRASIPGLSIDVITITRFNSQGLIEDYSAYYGPTDMHQSAE